MKVLLIATSLLCFSALAHKPSDSYLQLTESDGRPRLQWDLALKDLEAEFTLDKNRDGSITWGEIKTICSDIERWATSKLKINNGEEDCPILVKEELIDHRSDGAYLVLRTELPCKLTDFLDIEYELFFDTDAQHQAIATTTFSGRTGTVIFTDSRRHHKIYVRSPSAWNQFRLFLLSGVWHIWIGLDHVLFLLTLLIPSVVQRDQGRWIAIPSFRPILFRVLWVVTSFTVAHSITLAASALNVVSLPSKPVEVVIALSVVLTGINNIFPVLRKHWRLAFVFGLIHGFGFASVLRESGLGDTNLLLSLVSFNLGVELGQLAIVLVILPLTFWLRLHSLYSKVMVGLSSISAVVAALWMCERLFELELIPF